jgi:hypothetical protein
MRRTHTILAAGCGLLLACPAAAHSNDLHSFTGNGGDGASPYANITVDAHGNLFGTTFQGGNDNCALGSGLGCGTVFETAAPTGGSHAWTTSTIYTFEAGTDGGFPDSPLTLGVHGVLYGTTPIGAGGNVFSLSPPATQGGTWTFQNLYSFTGSTDGALTLGTNLLVIDGAVYGVTTTGGASTRCTGGCGTLFRLLPPASGTTWTYQRLISFKGGPHGAAPVWVAGPDASGHGYVAMSGGPGAILSVTPPTGAGKPWKDAVIYSFSGKHYGNAPTNLLIGTGGALFGIRGVYAHGVVFELTPPAAQGDPWSETTAYQFQGPYSAPTSLAPGPNGSLAGVSYGDVDFSNGAVWTLTPPAVAGSPWTYKHVKWHGLPSTDPVGVVFGLHGDLYGVMNGGDTDDGAVFEASPP